MGSGLQPEIYFFWGVFSHPFTFLFFFPFYSPILSGLSNQVKGFGKHCLLLPAGRTTLQPPDTFTGLYICQKCICRQASAANTFFCVFRA